MIGAGSLGTLSNRGLAEDGPFTLLVPPAAVYTARSLFRTYETLKLHNTWHYRLTACPLRCDILNHAPSSIRLSMCCALRMTPLMTSLASSTEALNCSSNKQRMPVLAPNADHSTWMPQTMHAPRVGLHMEQVMEGG